MARTLPWLRAGQPTGSGSSSNNRTKQPAQERTIKRRRLSTPLESDDGLDLNTTGVSTPERKTRLRRTKTPSTSPPPAPPTQEPMREGYAADDIWIMVEDEFLSTAQLYTQHLHHAEYQRLKALVKRHEATEVMRPVDPRIAMPAATKREIARNAQDKKASDGMTQIAGNKQEDMEEDDPWLRDPHLAGLMESPRKPARLLKGMGSGRSNTRAAAGFAQGSQQSPTRLPERPVHSVTRLKEEDEDDDEDDQDDDLDAPVKATTKHFAQELKRPPPKAPILLPEPKRQAGQSRDNVFRQFAKPDVKKEAISPEMKKRVHAESSTSARKPLPDFDDDLPVPIKREATAISDILARRKANAAKKERDEKRQSSTTNEIPTFLF